MSVNVSAHLNVDTPITHHVYRDASAAGPFVTVEIDDGRGSVAVMTSSPTALTHLIAVATVARAELEAMTNRAATAA